MAEKDLCIRYFVCRISLVRFRLFSNILFLTSLFCNHHYFKKNKYVCFIWFILDLFWKEPLPSFESLFIQIVLLSSKKFRIQFSWHILGIFVYWNLLRQICQQTFVFFKPFLLSVVSLKSLRANIFWMRNDDLWKTLLLFRLMNGAVMLCNNVEGRRRRRNFIIKFHVTLYSIGFEVRQNSLVLSHRMNKKDSLYIPSFTLYIVFLTNVMTCVINQNLNENIILIFMDSMDIGHSRIVSIVFFLFKFGSFDYRLTGWREFSPT